MGGADHAVCNLEDSPFYVFRACARGLVEAVEKLIQEDRGRATAADNRGWTCMHHAASRDKVKIIDLLLSYSSETLNARNHDGDTPLHLAAAGNRHGAVKHLLVLGADPNPLNRKKAGPIHLATTAGHSKVLRELVASLDADINLEGKNGNTSMHIASTLNLREPAEILLSSGAEFCAPNSFGFYPIHLAAKNAAKDALEAILAAADKQEITRERMFSFLDAENNNPLHSAVNGGDSEAVELCLRNGARVDAKADDEATPFHLACNQGNLAVVSLMLEIYVEDAENDVNTLLMATDVNGLTPLHRAAMYDHPDVVALLIEKGSDVQAKDAEGRTPLLLAAAKGGTRSLRALMSAGASVTVRDAESRNVLHFLVATGKVMDEELRAIYESPKGRSLLDQQDSSGCTPLHLATVQGNLAFLEGLLRLGAAVGLRDAKDQSALHFAARYGRLQTVERLLAHSNTIMNETDGAGRTPLHVAAGRGQNKVVSLLLQKGALLHKDYRGQTPLHLAAVRGFTQCVKILLSYHKNLLDIADKEGPIVPRPFPNSPLHLAAISDQAATVELLLGMEAAYAHNVAETTPLDLCILGRCTDSAMVMLGHSRWREFLDADSATFGSPILGLIQHLPHAYKASLDRFHQTSRLPQSDRHYWERFDFGHMQPEGAKASELAGRLADAGEQSGQVRRPLLYLNAMVKFGRVELLSHPVTLAYLEMKWHAFGSWVFYVNLLMYLLYVGSLTGILSEMNLDPQISIHMNSTTNGTITVFKDVESELEFMFDFSKTYHDMNISMRVMIRYIFFFVCANLLKELLQIYQQKVLYFFELVNLVEWILYSSSMFFAAPLMISGTMTYYQWEFGAIAIFLSWFNLLMHMQRTESMGLYVVMFLHIMRTVVKVLIVFFVLFVGFGLTFYILFTNDPTRGFNTPTISIIHTVMMMMGDWDFLHNFVTPLSPGATYTLPYPQLSFLFLIMFVLFMPILFINLIIGLAVGDIEMVQRDARLKRLAMQMMMWIRRLTGGLEDSTRREGMSQAIQLALQPLMLEFSKVKERQKELTEQVAKVSEYSRLLVAKHEIITEVDMFDEGDALPLAERRGPDTDDSDEASQSEPAEAVAPTAGEQPWLVTRLSRKVTSAVNRLGGNRTSQAIVKTTDFILAKQAFG